MSGNYFGDDPFGGFNNQLSLQQLQQRIEQQQHQRELEQIQREQEQQQQRQAYLSLLGQREDIEIDRFLQNQQNNSLLFDNENDNGNLMDSNTNATSIQNNNNLDLAMEKNEEDGDDDEEEAFRASAAALHNIRTSASPSTKKKSKKRKVAPSTTAATAKKNATSSTKKKKAASSSSTTSDNNNTKPDYKNSKPRQRLRAAKKDWDDAKADIEAAKVALEQAQKDCEQREKDYQSMKEECTDLILEEEKNRPWNLQFAKLKAYREEHGHCNLSSHKSTIKNKRPRRVPQTKEEEELERELGQFVARMRIEHNRGKLDEWKVLALTKHLDFVWDGNQAQWQDNYEKMKDYHSKHGRFPRGRKNHEEQILSRWIQNQRRNFKIYRERGFVEPGPTDGTGMNRKRRLLLEAMGLDWQDPGEDRWKHQFLILKNIFALQGHLRMIPADCDQDTVQFISEQRAALKKIQDGSAYELTPQRIALLNGIQFPWKDATTGTDATATIVSPDVAAAPGVTVALPADPLTVTTTTVAAPVAFAEKWMSYFYQVRAFFLQYRHFEYAEETFAHGDVKVMKEWDECQRQHYKQAAKKLPTLYLTAERLEILNSIGFFRPEEDRTWIFWMWQVHRFHRQYRHCQIGLEYPGSTWLQKLADWASKIREDYRSFRGKQVWGSSNLTPMKIQQLTSLGFNWGLPKPPRKRPLPLPSIAAKTSMMATTNPQSTKPTPKATGAPAANEENTPKAPTAASVQNQDQPQRIATATKAAILMDKENAPKAKDPERQSDVSATGTATAVEKKVTPKSPSEAPRASSKDPNADSRKDATTGA